MQLVFASKDALHAGSDVRIKVNIVGSQDTTGLMTSQELEAMAATVIFTQCWTEPINQVVILRPSGTVKRRLTSQN